MTARPFTLIRAVDVTGVSGTGVVAEGVEFSDGSCVVRWLGDWPTTVVHHERGIESVRSLHGHGGHTAVVYDDADPDPVARAAIALVGTFAQAEVEQWDFLREAGWRSLAENEVRRLSEVLNSRFAKKQALEAARYSDSEPLP